MTVVILFLTPAFPQIGVAENDVSENDLVITCVKWSLTGTVGTKFTLSRVLSVFSRLLWLTCWLVSGEFPDLEMSASLSEIASLQRRLETPSDDCASQGPSV